MSAQPHNSDNHESGNLATSFRDGCDNFANATNAVNEHGAAVTVAAAEPGVDGRKKSQQSVLHRFRHDKSILVLTIAGGLVYAGTQGGEILVSP